MSYSRNYVDFFASRIGPRVDGCELLQRKACVAQHEGVPGIGFDGLQGLGHPAPPTEAARGSRPLSGTSARFRRASRPTCHRDATWLRPERPGTGPQAWPRRQPQ